MNTKFNEVFQTELMIAFKHSKSIQEISGNHATKQK